MPHDLDAIMRFFKKVYPDKVKKWKRIYAKEVREADSEEELTFSLLREELSKNYPFQVRKKSNIKKNTCKKNWVLENFKFSSNL